MKKLLFIYLMYAIPLGCIAFCILSLVWASFEIMEISLTQWFLLISMLVSLGLSFLAVVVFGFKLLKIK